MKVVFFVVIASILLLFLSTLLSCGKNSNVGQQNYLFNSHGNMNDESVSNGGSIDPNYQSGARHIALAQAISDVANAKTPVGIDPLLYEELKAKLVNEFSRLYTPAGVFRGVDRNGSAVTFVDGTQAWCVQGTISTGGVATVYWRGRLVGDYDLDGEVGIPDITPIAENYLKTVSLDADGLPVVSGDNEYLAQVDGDSNGDVGISDITPIAQDYLTKLVGYRLYYGISDDGTNIVWQPSFTPNPDDAGLPVTLPYSDARDAGQVQMFDVSFPSPDLTAPSKLFVKIVAFDGAYEGSIRVIPLPEGPHMAFRCDTCHRVTDYQFRGEIAVCQMCHDKPPDNTAKNWSDAPGSHSSCMTCHEDHGFAIAQPETVCATCHTDITNRVSASLMTSCNMCHASFHVPSVPTSTTTCTSCHANPPENETVEWASAHPEHSNCFNCHADHNFKVTDIPGTCASCHGAISTKVAASAMTNCFDCHDAPHLPVAVPDVAICATCHPNPPENTSVDWATAPGQHDECAQCHSNHDFAITASPAVCGSCHNSIAAEIAGSQMQNCIDCHNAPHLPTGAPAQTKCQTCHTNPPENITESWTAAPGQHSTCSLCHLSHRFTVANADALCATCHSGIATELTASGKPTNCLECHTNTHLPVADPSPASCNTCHAAISTSLSDEAMKDCGLCHTSHDFRQTFTKEFCMTCHTNPPEEPASSWMTTKAQHRECANCHDLHDFKVDPPSSVCSSCHSLHGNPEGHNQFACLQCHLTPHKPETDQLIVCNLCH